jgi:anti-sigma factor RsiW
MLDLVDEPDLLDRLAELDLGICDGEPVAYVAPPPLTDRLLIPEAQGRWRSNSLIEALPDGHLGGLVSQAFDGLDAGLLESSATADSVFSARSRSDKEDDRRRTQHVIIPGIADQRVAVRIPNRVTLPRVVATHIVVSMLCAALGAAGAALVFHDRLDVAMARVEARMK